MAQITIKLKGFDPYKNYRFRIRWDGRCVAGFSKVSTLKTINEKMEYRKGGGQGTVRKSHRQVKFESITLERGFTCDLDFDQWAKKVQISSSGLGVEGPPKNTREEIFLEVHDEDGQLAIAYNILGCWVSEYQALPDLDANTVAILQMKLEFKTMERKSGLSKPR